MEMITTAAKRPLYLSEYRPVSELKVKSHDISYPKYPVIDIHGHFGAFYSAIYSDKPRDKKMIDETVNELKSCGIRAMVNLDGFWDGFMGITLDKINKTLLHHQDFLYNFVSVDISMIDQPGFEKSVFDHLKKAKDMGFYGIKIWKHLSLMIKDDKGEYIPGKGIRADDKRLMVIWETAAALELPVLIHIGDPKAFFKPVDCHNERYEQLLLHPEWSYFDSGSYSFDECMQMQENLLKNCPDTTFIIAHMGSCPEDLAFVGSLLDRYDNMHVDIAERIDELGRQPYRAKAFFEKYQDRILFGSDAYPEKMPLRYPPYFRFLETYDEYFGNGRWKLYGIGLDDEILKKIYYINAMKILKITKLQEEQK